MPRVLAWDISKNSTGACWDGPQVCPPTFQTFSIPHHFSITDLGRCCEAFVRWGHGLCSEVKPDILAIEAPLSPRLTKTGIDTARLLITLAGMAHYIARCNGVRVMEENVSTVKTHFGGSWGGSKEPVQARCRQLGWKFANSDEADAAALWSLVKCKTDPKFNYQTTPLFGHAAAADALVQAARQQ